MANPQNPDPPRHVAFFRNMNLGQARSRSPRSVQLMEAFTAAGAESVTNFQTNGTVIFSATDPAEVVERVRPLLLAATGYEDAVVLRSQAWLAELGPRLDPDLHAGEVALFDAPEVPQLELPWVDGAGEVAIVELDERHAVTGWAAAGTAHGSNPTLTRMLGVPVTCRGIPTMIRLFSRLSPPVNAHEVSGKLPSARLGTR